MSKLKKEGVASGAAIEVKRCSIASESSSPFDLDMVVTMSAEIGAGE